MTAKKEKKTATSVVLADNKKQVEKIHATQPDIESMLMAAIEKGAAVETIEKVMEMGEKIRARLAKEAFDNAMADLQSEMPVITKTKSVDSKYKYAPLDVIVSQVQKIISKNGFSYAIKIDLKEGNVTATCIVKHRLGHTEESKMEVPLTTKTQLMSQPQVVAATSTFAKRYAFCNAFGIMTGDADEELTVRKGNEQGAQSDNSKKIEEVRKLIKESGVPEEKFLTRLKANSLEELSLLQLQMIEKTIEERQPKPGVVNEAEVEGIERDSSGIPIIKK